MWQKKSYNWTSKKLRYPTIQWFRDNAEKMTYSLNALYVSIGVSKQAVHQYAQRQKELQAKVLPLVAAADELRAAHPGCGVEKMYYTLRPDFIGRDRFIQLFMELGYGIKRKPNYRKTTRRGSIYFPNLIGGMQVNGPGEVWQSDITYIQIGTRFC